MLSNAIIIRAYYKLKTADKGYAAYIIILFTGE